MKKIVASFLFLFRLVVVNAQVCDDPLIQSFDINTDGLLASYNTNCCPPSATNTFTQMTDSAGILHVWYTNDHVYVETTSLAYFTMGPWATNMTPSAQDLTFRIPRSVTPDVSGDLNTAESGTVGVGVDGVVMFAETSSKSWDGTSLVGNGDGIWNADAWVEEGYSMDDVGAGHANAVGTYHYHSTPVALYDGAGTGHSPIVGWALDGVPIYGPYGYDDSLDASSAVVRIESSYKRRSITQRHTLADGTVLTPDQYGPDVTVGGSYDIGTFVEDNEFEAGYGHLDDHNGRWCVTPEYPSGVYAYFITMDASEEPLYPYIVGPEYYGETSNGSGGYANIDASAIEYDPTACVSTGIDDILEVMVTVYPNPTVGYVQLSQVCEWYIYKTNGLIVSHGVGDSMNLSHLASDMYVLKTGSTVTYLTKQ